MEGVRSAPACSISALRAALPPEPADVLRLCPKASLVAANRLLEVNVVHGTHSPPTCSISALGAARPTCITTTAGCSLLWKSSAARSGSPNRSCEAAEHPAASRGPVRASLDAAAVPGTALRTMCSACCAPLTPKP